MSEGEDREVTRALAALAAEMSLEEAPARVEAALVGAFRARRSRRVAVRWALVAGAVAAGLLLAVAVRPGSRVEPLPTPRIAHAGRAPAWKPPAVAAPAAVASRAPARRRAPVRPATPAGQTSPAEEEVASDFFALRPGPLVEPGEMAPLVRVRLPRYEMRRFGLPVGPEPLRTIEADVLVGQDGMARAIRFVSTRAR
jgi:hypothetical protein